MNSLLGTLFSGKYDIDKELRLLEKEINTIESIKQMRNTEGWHEFVKVIGGRIDSNKYEIDGLLSNATKNGKEIEKRYWSCSMYRELLKIVETALDAEPDIRIKHKKLIETAKSRELATAR